MSRVIPAPSAVPSEAKDGVASMSIESRRELELTQSKLKLLEDRLADLLKAPEENRRAQEWSVRSLTQTINQLKEEMARFESRAKSAPQKP